MDFAVHGWHYFDALKTTFSTLSATYSQRLNSLAARSPTLKEGAFYVASAGKSFFWNHKKLVILSAISLVTLWIVDYIRKRRPQYPIVQMESSLNHAVLTVQSPLAKRVSKNVTLTFCIDMSGSMEPDERFGAVKRALCSILEDAQSRVNNSETNISFAIVGFNDQAQAIAPPTPLARTGNVQDIKHTINQLHPNGSTDILAGLSQATKELQKLAQHNPTASHTIIALTDGEHPNINQKGLKAVHAIWTSIKVTPFSIGVGAGHNKEITQKIASSQGTYIDTTLGKENIESAISKIYQQAVLSFSGMQLTCPQLADDQWTLDGKKDHSLEALSEEKTIRKKIQILPHTLKASLDLKDVLFYLDFTDPQGKKGRMLLPWNPDTIINPAIFK